MQSNAKSKNGFHLREICPQDGCQLRNPNPDFMDFLFTVRLRNPKKDCKTVLVNSGVFFAVVNYACARGRYNSKDSLTFRAFLHEGVGPQVGVVTCGELPTEHVNVIPSK